MDETPPGDQQPQPGDTSGGGNEDGDATGDNAVSDEGGAGDPSTGQENASGDAHSARDKGERNANKGKTDESGADTPAEDGT